MAIKCYTKGSGIKLAPNFRSAEFDCKGNGCCSRTKVDERLVEFLQQIRDHFGAAVTITSAYRCKTHNSAVGGAAGSRHLSGMAADIKVSGVASREVAKFAESIGVQGIGLYESDTDGYFVHIDTRQEKSFWYGKGEQRLDTFEEKTATEYTLTLRQMKKGSQGDDVLALQILLRGRGFDCGCDGIFGLETEAAVKAWQMAKKLQSDGVVGKDTFSGLLGRDDDE